MDELKRVGRQLLFIWVAISAASVVALAAGIMVRGVSFFYAFQGPPEASLVEVKFLVFAVAWFILGCALGLTQWPDLLRRHGAFLVAWGLLATGYLNWVRGPHKVEHKDFSNYFTAAVNMRDGVPLTNDPFQLYLYPPLLATLLEPLTLLGLGPASWLFRFGNLVAVVLFALLVYLTAQRIGANRITAVVLMVASVGFNVAIVDTLAAQQVNLHVANLVLASLLLFPRHVALSAIALAVGAHLKVYPVLLAAPFVLLRQWRWCAWFGAAVLAIAAGTSLVNSPDYYLQFLHRLSELQEYGIRNASVAALLHNTARFAGLDLGAVERPLATALSVGCGALIIWWGWPAIRDGVLFPAADRRERIVGSAFAVLSIVMLVISPSIWPHHLVLTLLPALALALAVRTAADAAYLAVAWFLIALIPVHEIYPLAYLRLAGVLLLGLLFRRVARDAALGRPPLATDYLRGS
jgi:hypothetical protein